MTDDAVTGDATDGPVANDAATAEPAKNNPAANGRETGGSGQSARGRFPDEGPVLPEQSRDDTDLGWGERSSSNDDRLLQDRPPHWD